ncbi:hypothetical protein OKW21_001330 [Catalinimonas alkaloidigena]|uniref:hypothetical protein n=1 Tax=Catalinimonas alkaloidigena TaxID=1075417 RepID=UPI0024061491|nr:hypothetical protein [Catalinimonas alkaloidigena]MDF9796067.1 hypothetical protein [Catalinimonas alkaloidigena]
MINKILTSEDRGSIVKLSNLDLEKLHTQLSSEIESEVNPWNIIQGLKKFYVMSGFLNQKNAYSVPEGILKLKEILKEVNKELLRRKKESQKAN